MLWGQSVGAGVAVQLAAATMGSHSQDAQQGRGERRSPEPELGQADGENRHTHEEPERLIEEFAPVGYDEVRQNSKRDESHAVTEPTKSDEVDGATQKPTHGPCKQGTHNNTTGTKAPGPNIKALILETPFLSVRRMLQELYPQKWLPYRYLSPFLWNHWDTPKALSSMAAAMSDPNIGPRSRRFDALKVLIMQAENDELVPSTHGAELEKLCREINIDVTTVVARNALHNEASIKYSGKEAIVRFLDSVAHP